MNNIDKVTVASLLVKEALFGRKSREEIDKDYQAMQDEFNARRKAMRRRSKLRTAYYNNEPLIWGAGAVGAGALGAAGYNKIKKDFGKSKTDDKDKDKEKKQDD